MKKFLGYIALYLPLGAPIILAAPGLSRFMCLIDTTWLRTILALPFFLSLSPAALHLAGSSYQRRIHCSVRLDWRRRYFSLLERLYCAEEGCLLLSTLLTHSASQRGETLLDPSVGFLIYFFHLLSKQTYNIFSVSQKVVCITVLNVLKEFLFNKIK